MTLLSRPLPLLRSTLLAPRSLSLLRPSPLHLLPPSPSSPSPHHHPRFYTSSPPPPPPPTRKAGKALQELQGQGQGQTGGEVQGQHENAKLFSKEDTLSYRELLMIFSETITKAFNTPFTPPSTQGSSSIGAYTESLKRPGLKIMEDPGTFVMVERIRDAGEAEGMEMEEINQHILSILDTIAPPPEKAVFSTEERKMEAEQELKDAVDKVKAFKDENAAFLATKRPHILTSYLPFSLGDKLNARAVAKRNNNDVRILRLMARIMDCGFEAGRDPKEMSHLLKSGYFPPGQPPSHTLSPLDGKTVVPAGEEERFRGPPTREERRWPGTGSPETKRGGIF